MKSNETLFITSDKGTSFLSCRRLLKAVCVVFFVLGILITYKVIINEGKLIVSTSKKLLQN